jgi:hypothetical protein
MDLHINTVHPHCEVQRPFKFYEGTTTVSGTVDGVTVTGQGFAELVKGYEPPDIVMDPFPDSIWEVTTPVQWQLINPDDGLPLHYDLEYTTDIVLGFFPVIQGINDTLFTWADAPLQDGEKCWIRVRGYSVDTTLAGYSNTVHTTVQNTGNSISEHMEDPAEDTRLNIYPNPARDFVTIQFRVDPSTLTYRIMDIAGKQIVESALEPAGKTVRLDIRMLEPGTYILWIIADKEYSTRFQVVD